ncbi:hypothetical protein F4775DRAFT_12673 [Biscogniauxia sp. FL1348]|nr:hypothetical protein F4775DRAFT_12673 [Biscogniauxia sp. FL1348]
MIRVWRIMMGLECLIKGEPQSVTDGSILLAISAWHVYPNTLVLGTQTTTVDFADPLIPAERLLAVGITTSEYYLGPFICSSEKVRGYQWHEMGIANSLWKCLEHAEAGLRVLE